MANRDKSERLGVAEQIPRNSLALLMIAQVAVILPLSPHISLWVVGVCLVCGYWRTQVYRGRWGYPSGVFKGFLVVAASLGIALSGYTTFSLEAAASLLVVAFALKLIEMKSRRDAYLIIFLSYFLVAIAFLFSQTMTATTYAVLAMVVVTAAMVGMNQMQTRIRPIASIRLAAGLVGQAIPLMLVMFLLFPRVGPMWSIPMPSSASTGLSDKLTPGDVASLSQSDELAFRAEFDGAVPLQRELYWRGLVYSNFREGTWSVGRDLEEETLTFPGTANLSYEVFMEPTQTKWVYALDTPVTFSPKLSVLADYRLVSEEPILSVFRYRVTSNPLMIMDAVLPEHIRARETHYPTVDSPRMQAYARELYRSARGDAETVITLMLEQIRNEEYAYTLNPPTLGSVNSVDSFWFDSRRGFCTHYAGAMVFALRSLDIPARLVGGYQGGEVNPVTGHVVVRQYQAHAWVEAWIEGKGWVRYDPTAAVAPERVEQGLNAALSSADRATLSFFANARLSSGDLLNNFLQFVDSLEHRWNVWVVGYDAATQTDILRSLLGEVTPARVGMALLVGGVVSVALAALVLFWRRRPGPKNPTARALGGFYGAMSRRGLPREEGETPAAYLTRLGLLAQTDVEGLVALTQRQLYDPHHVNSREQLRTLRRELRKLKFRLAFRPAKPASLAG
ncbi:MAG: DUF3488 and transglutaminase-like domain-containing protein [Pseudomonadota bacterium]